MASLLYLTSMIWGAFVLPLSLTLLIVSVTTSGRIFATCACIIGICPLLLAGGWLKRRSARIKTATFLCIAMIPLIAFLLVVAPKPKTSASARLLNLYSKNGNSSFHEYCIANLLPEVDQLLLGFTIMPLVDPYFTITQSIKLKTETKRIYQEMDSDEGFFEVGSSMAEVYSDLFGFESFKGHSYLYVPSGVRLDGSAKLIVFIHGSGGNFKAYTWILAKLAEQQKAILVAPSGGMGYWHDGDAASIVLSSMEAVFAQAPYDRRNVHILGLSNGGLALSQLIEDERFDFKSISFISPVFSSEILTSYIPNAARKSVPILVVSGMDDDRVPMSYVSSAVSSLRMRDLNIRLERVVGADHFLMFTHQSDIVISIDKWISASSIKN